MKTTVKKEVRLPKQLESRLKCLEFPNTKADIRTKSLRLLSIIFDKQTQFGMQEFIALDSKYLIKTLGWSYNSVITFLINNNVIEVYKNNNGTEYSISRNECKKYRINQNLTVDTTCVIIPIEFKEELNEEVDNPLITHTLNCMSQIRMNVAEANRIKQLSLSLINKKSFQINEQIQFTSKKSISIQFEFGKSSYFYSFGEAMNKAKKDKVDLIKDGNNYYIMSVEDFLSTKRRNMLFYYENVIWKIASGLYYAKRNNTNNRLDTNLTNLPSELIMSLLVDNRHLDGIDLSNSQFCLLSDLIRNERIKFEERNPYDCLKVEDCGWTQDVSDFFDHSENGSLYDFIGDKLSVDRQQAKTLMFLIMFSKRKFQCQEKKMVKSLFPSVVNFIDMYKEMYGDNNFCILLQKTESAIFIDKILTRLSKAGVFALTKHDSVLCKDLDRVIVEGIIREELTALGIRHSLKIDQHNECLERFEKKVEESNRHFIKNVDVTDNTIKDQIDDLLKIKEQIKQGSYDGVIPFFKPNTVGYYLML